MLFVFKRDADEFDWPAQDTERIRVYAVDAQTVTTQAGEGRVEIGYLAPVRPGESISGILVQSDECVVRIPG